MRNKFELGEVQSGKLTHPSQLIQQAGADTDYWDDIIGPDVLLFQPFI